MLCVQRATCIWDERRILGFNVPVLMTTSVKFWAGIFILLAFVGFLSVMEDSCPSQENGMR